jgi:hypothetical protein
VIGVLILVFTWVPQLDFQCLFRWTVTLLALRMITLPILSLF